MMESRANEQDSSTDVEPTRWHDSWVRYCELGRVGLILHKIDWPVAGESAEDRAARLARETSHAVCLVSVTCEPCGYHGGAAAKLAKTLYSGRLDEAEEVYAQCEANLRAGEYDAWAGQF